MPTGPWITLSCVHVYVYTVGLTKFNNVIMSWIHGTSIKGLVCIEDDQIQEHRKIYLLLCAVHNLQGLSSSHVSLL